MNIHSHITALLKLTSLVALLLPCIGHAQAAGVQTIAKFELLHTDYGIHQTAAPRRPFSVAGPGGTIVGQQDGSLEVWNYPVKILSRLHLKAELEDYPVPIDLNQQAATIDVEPDHTTIVYSHAAITVRQHMFITRDPQTGPVILFEIASRRAAHLTIEFQPELQRQWPALNTRVTNASFMDLQPGSAFVLSGDVPQLAAMVAMPQAEHGVIIPFQERPVATAASFRIHYDPARDSGRYYPMLFALCDGEKHDGQSTREVLRQRVAQEAALLPTLYAQTRSYYEHFFDRRLTVNTPDANVNEAARWAAISIDQLKVRHGKEDGFIAGLAPSGDSNRPGFGWFFGRDTLWALYALHSEGDFATARQALEFLIARQREDGKIMHELSQAAERVDWKSLPYQFAAADATPLFVMLMEDYYRSSGDRNFIAAHWQQIARAYQFTRAHETHGMMDNNEGTGWVEGWAAGMPDQELYLAALDEQSADAFARLAHTMGEDELATSAHKKSANIEKKLAEFRGEDGIYAFSRNEDGSYDRTPTVYPSVAWWSGRLNLPASKPMLNLFAGSALATDWGTRSVAPTAKNYDPISYHQGSVWPLFTGWTAMAEYRAARPLAGLQMLMANVNLGRNEDPGHLTEVISGDVNEPLGRSTPHQLWSAAMVLSPLVRGLFGTEADVANGNLRVAPQLPAEWNEASLHHLQFGAALLDVTMQRNAEALMIHVHADQPTRFCLTTQTLDEAKPCTQQTTTEQSLRMALPAVEVELPRFASRPGEQSHGLRVVDETRDAHSLALTLEAPAGSAHTLRLHGKAVSSPALQVEGGTLTGSSLAVRFATGEAIQKTKVVLRW